MLYDLGIERGGFFKIQDEKIQTMYKVKIDGLEYIKTKDFYFMKNNIDIVWSREANGNKDILNCQYL